MTNKEQIVSAGQIVLDTIISKKNSSKYLKNMNKISNTQTLGGPPFFSAFIASKLMKIFPWIESPLLYAYTCFEAYMLLKKFPEFNLLLKDLAIKSKCPQFRLVYTHDNRERELFLENPPSDYNPLDFNWNLNQPIVAILGSIYHEFNRKEIIEFINNKCNFIAFDAQGCFRQIATNNNIVLKNWCNNKILEKIDCFKVSELEARFLGLGTKPFHIIKRLFDFPIKIVLLSRGKKGVIMGIRNFSDEKVFVYKIPAYPVIKLINETGLGDILLFTFVNHFSVYRNALDAISFATSIVSMFIENNNFQEPFIANKISFREKIIRSKITELNY